MDCFLEDSFTAASLAISEDCLEQLIEALGDREL